MKKIIYRIIVYLIVLAAIFAFAFGANAGKSDPDMVYWIIGGVLLGLFLVFVAVNEIMIFRKSHIKKEKDKHEDR